jgi:hypothetical protein
MAPVFAQIFAVVLSLTWANLSMTYKPNPMHGRFLSSKDIVSGIMSAASLSFAPGLFEALDSQVAPSIAFFKSLPNDFRKRWGVYVIVLEKEGCAPKVYIGSGTGWASGVWTRIMCYIRGDQLPVNVLKALRDGFTITHKGPLVWAPMPPAEEKPTIRLLFIALEAMFHFVFWSMASKTAKNHWVMKAMCPFDFEDLEYDGCNTHNPLYEQPFGDYDLSPEERKAHEEEMYERQLNDKRTRREQAKQEDPEAYREEIVAQGRKWRADNPEGAH